MRWASETPATALDTSTSCTLVADAMLGTVQMFVPVLYEPALGVVEAHVKGMQVVNGATV